MNKTDKIYIAGHTGMVGSAIFKALVAGGFTNFVYRSSKELDLRNQAAVEQFFSEEKPQYVFLAAARVGAEEKGKVKACNNPDHQLPIGKVVVSVDKEYFRPTEVELLIGDPTKAKTKLGWVPKHDLATLVKEMVVSDLALAKKNMR